MKATSRQPHSSLLFTFAYANASLPLSRLSAERLRALREQVFLFFLQLLLSCSYDVANDERH